MQSKVIAVVGPTASGKTALGIEIAKCFDGEIISCDSMQIYRHLDIGTAKPSKEEMQGVPHHMIDIADISESYSVGRFCEEAHEKIKDILSRGKLPILVGGTGLYIDNLVSGTLWAAPPRDEKLSSELLAFAEKNGSEAVYERLKRDDPEMALKLHPNDLKRVIRSLETVILTGKTRKELDSESKPYKMPYDCLWLEKDIEREALYERINRRTDIMIEEGLIEETEKYVLPERYHMPTALQAIGYKEALLYIDGECGKEEMSQLLKRNTRRYAKRQLTWFRRNTEIHLLSEENAFKEAERLIRKDVIK